MLQGLEVRGLHLVKIIEVSVARRHRGDAKFFSFSLTMDLWLPNIAPSSVTLFPCFFSPDPWPGDLLLLHADGLHTVLLGLSEAVTVAAGERSSPLG